MNIFKKWYILRSFQTDDIDVLLTKDFSRLTDDMLPQLSGLLSALHDHKHPRHELLMKKLFKECDPEICSILKHVEWQNIPYHLYMNNEQEVDNVWYASLLRHINKITTRTQRAYVYRLFFEIIREHFHDIDISLIQHILDQKEYRSDLITICRKHSDAFLSLNLWDELNYGERLNFLEGVMFIEHNIPHDIREYPLCGFIRHYDSEERHVLSDRDMRNLKDKILNMSYSYVEGDIVFHDRNHVLWFFEVLEWVEYWSYDQECVNYFNSLVICFFQEKVMESFSVDYIPELKRYLLEHLKIHDIQRLEPDIQLVMLEEHYETFKLLESILHPESSLKELIFYQENQSPYEECSLIL